MMIGTMIDGTSSGSSGGRGMSEVSKTRGCTLPEGDNGYGYGGMGMSRESRKAWALGVGGKIV